MATARKTRRPKARKIGRRAANHRMLSERYTLSTLPDRNVVAVTPGDRYFAVRGGAGALGVVRGGRVVGWIDVGRLHHLSVRDWMAHVGQKVEARRPNPDWAAMRAKAAHHGTRAWEATKSTAKRAGAAARRGTKKAAPHVARGFRSLSARLDRYAENPSACTCQKPKRKRSR